MKESRLYIRYLNKNSWLILMPTFLGILIGFLLLSKDSDRFIIRQVYKVELGNINESETKVKQIVGNLRAVKNKFVSKNEDLNVYQTGPDTAEVDVSTKGEGLDSIKMVDGYIQKNFKVFKINSEVKKKETILRTLFLPAFGGFLFGLFVSLLKTYFNSY